MIRFAFSCNQDNGLNSTISEHFGKCSIYLFIDIVDRNVISIKSLPNPFLNNHTPGAVPSFIHENNANIMISGGMGQKAIEFFTSYGIEVCTGVSGTIKEALNLYYSNQLKGVEPCKHDISDHNCNH